MEVDKKDEGDLTGDGGVLKEIVTPGVGTERPENGDEVSGEKEMGREEASETERGFWWGGN